MNATEGTASGRAELTYELAADVVPAKPEWLWQQWVLLRALNLLTGRQGSGKTTFAAHVIAALTLGAALPGSSGHPPVRCAVLSLEEPSDRVVARLHAAGADLDLVLVIGDILDHDDEGRSFRRRWALPQDISTLGDLIVAHDLKLVVIDGLGYSIAGDSHNYAVVGSALAALAGEAERSGCAILGLVHPPKGASDPVTAAIGSTAWTAIPRISIVLGVDPNDDTGATRVVRVGKSNYRKPDSGLSFAIGDDPTYECGFVKSLQASDIAAEDITAAPATPGEKGERAEARDFLRTALVDGPMEAAEITRVSGFTSKTLQRARNDLGVLAEPRRDERGKVKGWTWRLPDSQTASLGHLVHLDRDSLLNTTSEPEGPEGQASGTDHLGCPPGLGNRVSSAADDERLVRATFGGAA